ncbi:MAG: hypothetical protein GY820_09945, partial [Gammaproteobacteria bacterium]|nr:hypothetical protein [Gammaproteobacteria bacterium]
LTKFSPNLESIFVNITNTDKHITIGTIYRPHNGDDKKFNIELELILKMAPSNKSYVMGDFNMDLFATDNPTISEYEEIIITNGFSPLISTYTHQQPGCRKTCIDNILTNCFDSIKYTGAITDNLKHHLPVFQISYIGTVNSSKNPEKTAVHYDFSTSNVENFVNELSQQDLLDMDVTD